MAAPPARTEISDTYPNPSNAVARTGFGKLWDYATALLGLSGDAVDARAALGAQLEPGLISFYSLSSPPAGWIKANGAAVSRTTYAALFAAIGTAYGAGNGTTTFNVPELRGEFLRALDDSRGIDSGRAIGSAQAQAIESHNHAIVTVGAPGSGGSTGVSAIATGAPQGTITTYITAAGGTETRPRNVALLACIKY